MTTGDQGERETTKDKRGDKEGQGAEGKRKGRKREEKERERERRKREEQKKKEERERERERKGKEREERLDELEAVRKRREMHEKIEKRKSGENDGCDRKSSENNKNLKKDDWKRKMKNGTSVILMTKKRLPFVVIQCEQKSLARNRAWRRFGRRKRWLVVKFEHKKFKREESYRRRIGCSKALIGTVLTGVCFTIRWESRRTSFVAELDAIEKLCGVRNICMRDPNCTRKKDGIFRNQCSPFQQRHNERHHNKHLVLLRVQVWVSNFRSCLFLFFSVQCLLLLLFCRCTFQLAGITGHCYWPPPPAIDISAQDSLHGIL